MMKGVCKFFETGKKCPYGDRCRFKHKLGSSNSATPGQKGHNRQTFAPSSSAEGGHPNGSPSNDNDHANLLKKWLYYVPKEKRKSRPLGDDELAKFVGLALKLLESSADNMQLVISVLGEECGLVRVREIIDRNFENMDDDKLEAFIAALLLPYFRILSHDTVLQSMVVETQHTALLNTLYGINGERGSNIFTALARGLSAREDHECIEIVIAVLAGVLERNSSAMANTNLQAAAEVLVSLLDVSNLSRAGERHLRTIKAVLHLAINLPETCAIADHLDPDAVATFRLAQDLPGALSERGPRHDNDSEDIQDIEILPTLQEILSERTEYLPREDPNLWHIRGLPGLIDRNFRLVREDTVGQLRDAVKAQLYHQRSAGDTPRVSEQEVRTNAYHGVSLYNVMFDAKKGLLFVLRFQQPQLLHGKSSKKREDWWQESQRLAPESLICLLSSSEEANQEATFLVVHSPDLGPAPPKPKTTGPSIHKQHTLWKDREHAFVTAQLASTEPFAASDFIKGCLSSRQVRRSLIEFPGVLLPTFGPTLSALQRMAASLDVPFAEALIPDANRAEPRRPAYSVRGGFRYNLRGLLPEDLRDQYRNTDNTPQGIASALELSGLDKTQREAAQHALTHAIGLIQGPPGTGKSYTGVKILQALLDNKHAANLGPIICVCYTNHALDQLLENLLDAGISQIVRIGSRSRSERLAGINLRTLAWQHSFTKMEGKHWFDSKRSIEESGQAINQLVQRLRSILRNPEKEIISLLNAEYPYFCAQLPQDVDEDGFIVVHGKKTSSCWRTWWKEGPALPFARDRSLAVLRSGTVRLFDMTRGEREALHNSWIDELTSCIYQDLRIELATFNRNKAAMESLRGDVDLRVLSNANVVGVTTTGLARQLGTLFKLRSKVLVVEEAGEVLEAHLLTAMLPSLEHAILIGDHQQLRPKVQNYDLSAENPRSNQIALDVSLFERLIHPRQENVHGLPYVTLETQRRMHPYVSRLIRSTLYPNLQDAESVKTYPEVVGMRKRLFWMDHKKKEDGKRTQMQSASRTNRYEVEMVAALVGHLQKQGVYTANDIAVLTPYLGQLRHLKEKLQNSFGIILNDRDIDELAQEDATKDVEPALAADSSRRRISMTKGTLLQAIRLATVDNFQGEEAKVVIISLVRSNDSNNCGFLRTPNRINVLLSRAKHGMYILGNSATASSVPMWQRILEIFRTEGNIGTVLELSCPRHPDTAMQVTEPEDFSRVAPEAGCDLMCGKQLPCGHACPSKCHAESLHNGVHCLKDCVRPRKGCTHPCKRACGNECEAQCAIIIQCDITLPCGHHVTRMPCWSYQDTARYICREPVERQVPGCGHDVVVACHIAVDDPAYCCQERCSSTLECGHNCQSACFECRPRNHEGKSDTINHAKCTHRCGRSFTSCVHSCPEQCHTGEPCPPCSSNCEVRCIHSACQKQCHEPCTPCMEEKCPSFCEHAECQMPCGAPCDWVPCSKRCKKVLGCGHQCPSMCGEMCPSSKFCQVCATEEVRDSTVDLYTLETYAELDLDKTPCLFPPCGHIFTVETLDGQMDISKHYHMDEVEHLSVPVSIKDDLLPLSYENLKTCPNCRGCLRTIARYGRVIRRALLDESTKKFIAWSHQAYLPLAEKIQQKQGELLKTVGQTPLIAEVSFTGPSTLAAAIRRSTAGRYSAFLKLRCAIANFTNKVRAEEQPFQRVRDLVESVRRRQTIDMPRFEYDRSILQTRGTLLAIALGLRCDLVIITDLVRNWESMPRQQRSAKPLAINLSEYRMECDSFHESAMKSKYPLQQAEGHIFWAHFAALECGATLALDGNSLQKSEALKREAVLHLNQSTEICRMFPGQTNSVTSEVNGVREMLDKSISSAEMRMVVAVMSREFSVTGHWYCCTNGHPFTIGECGGPMEQTRCPECGAPIGGQRHIAAAGVTRAENIEREFGNLHMEE